MEATLASFDDRGAGAWDDEETMMALADVLTEVASGRVDGHRCPRCDKALDCNEDDRGWLHVRCTGCGLRFDGMLG